MFVAVLLIQHYDKFNDNTPPDFIARIELILHENYFNACDKDSVF